MNIQNIDNSANAGPARLQTATEARQPPKSETNRERADPVRPPPPRRQPNLVSMINQSLQQNGIQATSVTAVPGTNEAQSTEASNDQESGQTEKINQALQAFMHTLVQAMNDKRPDTTDVPATGGAARGTGSALEDAPPLPRPADPYGGLVSRLDSLARELEGSQATAASNPAIRQLDNAFRSLTATGTEDTTAKDSGASLQTVLRTMIRNLQSTGDPTLASTGNVINTSA